MERESMPDLRPMASPPRVIRIRGARVHNLQNVDVDLPCA